MIFHVKNMWCRPIKIMTIIKSMLTTTDLKLSLFLMLILCSFNLVSKCRWFIRYDKLQSLQSILYTTWIIFSLFNISFPVFMKRSNFLGIVKSVLKPCSLNILLMLTLMLLKYGNVIKFFISDIVLCVKTVQSSVI